MFDRVVTATLGVANIMGAVTIDPQIARLLRTLALAPKQDATPQQRRASFAALLKFADIGSPVGDIENHTLPAGPPVRIYTPLPSAPPHLPAIVFLHGGGFVCGDLDGYDPLMRTLCHDTACRVIAVDYRLAPEHRFPAALTDAHAATLWVIENAARLGIDPARIAIAGDSAGAGLAAAICRMLAASHPGALALQLLICPILDWTAQTASRRSFAHGYLLDSAHMAQELAWYLPSGQSAADPRISPLLAPSLAGQPPAHIHIAECDPVRDEALDYAAALRSAGIPVQHTLHPGMVHLFYGLGRIVPHARMAVRQIGTAARAALAGRVIIS